MDIGKEIKNWREYESKYLGGDPSVNEETERMIVKARTYLTELDRLLVETEEMKEEKDKEIEELKSLCLWLARRVPKSHKKFAYDDYDKITGEKSERL